MFSQSYWDTLDEAERLETYEPDLPLTTWQCLRDAAGGLFLLLLATAAIFYALPLAGR